MGTWLLLLLLLLDMTGWVTRSKQTMFSAQLGHHVPILLQLNVELHRADCWR
jgi:hypothetical protein